MKRLFDKAIQHGQLLRWLGIRPVDAVRAAERRARSADKPERARRPAAALAPAGPMR